MRPIDYDSNSFQIQRGRLSNIRKNDRRPICLVLFAAIAALILSGCSPTEVDVELENLKSGDPNVRWLAVDYLFRASRSME